MSKPQPAATLLVVDDDAGLLRLTSKTLVRQGFTVSTATTAHEAMLWLKASRPDLLLLDLKLGEMDARHLITELYAQKCLPPFIIITGQGDERVAVELMKSGARDYLVKGKDFLDFLPSVVSRVLKELQHEGKLAAAEAALRLSDERFRVALKHSPITVFNQDADLKFTWIHNPPGGRPESDFIGRTDVQIFPVEEADRLTQIKMRVMMTGTGVRQEISGTDAGRDYTYDLTVEPVSDAEGQITGITGAAMDITERKRLGQEVLQISEMEQRRIGQDLHDGICQHLTGIEFMSHALSEKLKAKSKTHSAGAEEIARHVRNVIGQTRSLARGLSPFILESEGLASGLRELAAGAGKMFSVKCNFNHDGCAPPADLTVATHLYRVAQEAVANAVKHGKARTVDISLTARDGNMLLVIGDDGAGFRDHPSATGGMGLRIMQYRAGIIGATLLTQRTGSGGARIVCFLPQTGGPPPK